MLIDLSRMSEVRVDPATGLAHVGAGARAGVLTASAAPHGLAPLMGMNPNVGVGGLTLGGGMGWLAGRFGATVDHLLAVELVTADGRKLRADAREHADLFWALRGGGGNFGVATAFAMRMQPVTQVLAGDIGFKAAPTRFLRFLREFLAASPDELELAVLFTLAPNPVVMVRLCWSGDPAAGERVLAPLRGFATVALDTVKPQLYGQFATAGLRFDTMFLRGGEFSGLTDRVIDAFAGIVDQGGPKDCMIGVLHYLHGVLCRVPLDSTPFLRQAGHILYNIVAPWQGAGRQSDKIGWALGASETLRAVNSKRIYINYLSYEGGDYVRDAYGPHYDRLRAVKRRYDPDNVFRNNRNIRA
jgi:FAD/FMN-containing dehydrogenase